MLHGSGAEHADLSAAGLHVQLLYTCTCTCAAVLQLYYCAAVVQLCCAAAGAVLMLHVCLGQLAGHVQPWYNSTAEAAEQHLSMHAYVMAHYGHMHGHVRMHV